MDASIECNSEEGSRVKDKGKGYVCSNPTAMMAGLKHEMEGKPSVEAKVNEDQGTLASIPRCLNADMKRNGVHGGLLRKPALTTVRRQGEIVLDDA